MKKPTTTDLPGYVGAGSGPGGGDIPAARRCTRTRLGRYDVRPLTCLHRLADGRIIPANLCGPCTSRFMNALDLAAGEKLPWHRNFTHRAEETS
jgi:hypothetical protein